MVRYFFIAFMLLIVASDIYGQAATPSRYTTYLRLRCYATGANASADSLNANNDRLDSTYHVLDTTLASTKEDVRNVIGYDGGIVDGSVAFNDLSTANKAVLVQTTGTQSIGGVKTFTDRIYTDGIVPNDHDTYNLGGREEAWHYIYATRLIITTTDGSDSTIIGYDGTNITMDKNVTFDDTTKTIGDATNQLNAIYADSVKSPNDVIISGNHIIMQGIFGIGGGTLSSHTIGATDSVTIVPTSSFVLLNTTATTSVSSISPSAITPGLIYIITTDGSDTVTLLDGTGNLQLEGNFAMDTASDVIVLMKSGTVAGGLVELFRSNNE